MSAVKNLEALIKLENDLKAQYESEISALKEQIATLTGNNANLQSVIDEQQKLLAETNASSTDVKRLEQINRELNNRAENLQADVETQKSRAKSLQKDLNEARQQIKTLEQFDAEKLKKNLVATKQTLTEQRAANELLKKSTNETRKENADLKKSLADVQAELASLKEATEAIEDTEPKAA